MEDLSMYLHKMRSDRAIDRRGMSMREYPKW